MTAALHSTVNNVYKKTLLCHGLTANTDRTVVVYLTDTNSDFDRIGLRIFARHAVHIEYKKLCEID